MLRYLIGFITTIALIIVLIMLIFHGGGKPKVPATSKTLDSYSTTDAQVSLTVDGPINADQNHQQIQINVSNTAATFEQITGYQGNVVKQQSYANNTDAFTNFLFALEKAGFTKGNNSTIKDERGYCSTGDRYIFKLVEGGSTLERYWATNCGNPKTYAGNLSLTLTLFQNQIPDYESLTSNIIL